jgi:hypothetical protein
MGVADRARKRMPQAGDYLDKDDLIRNQDEPFGVATCVYDEHGTNYGPRWVLSLIPWFEEQEGPKGLLTFTANPTRNPFLEDLQAQIEENDNEPIGPLTVIKGKSQKGFRYYTLDDWKETAAPAEATSASAPARPARPAAPAPQQEAAAANPPADTPPDKPKRGRPRKASVTPSTTETPSASPSSPPIPAIREPGPGEAAKAQEVSVPTNVGSVVCPDCHQTVEGRILPDDSVAGSSSTPSARS